MPLPSPYGPVSGDKHWLYSQIPSFASFFFSYKAHWTQMKHHTKDYRWSVTAPLLYVKRMHHNYWSCALKPRSCSSWVHEPQLKPSHPRARGSSTREATAVRSPCTATRAEPLLITTREKSTQLWRPSTAKNKYKYSKPPQFSHTLTACQHLPSIPKFSKVLQVLNTLFSFSDATGPSFHNSEVSHWILSVQIKIPKAPLVATNPQNVWNICDW